MANQVYTISGLLDALVDAIDIARDLATGDQRWVNAINAAADHLLQVETVEIDDHGALTYHSESGETYKANGTCQCRAHLNGQPCKHRAASKLVKNALARHPARPATPGLIAERLTAARARIAQAERAAAELFA